MEIPITGFENYTIDIDGNVYSLPKKTRKGKRKLKPVKYNNGYLIVDLVKNGKIYKKSVHRLVALAFLENKENYPQVNHINGNKQDNRLVNLEWVTRSENQKHAIKIGLRSAKGEKNSQCKLNESIVFSIYNSNSSYTDLANHHNISLSTIYDIKKKRSWSHIHN